MNTTREERNEAIDLYKKYGADAVNAASFVAHLAEDCNSLEDQRDDLNRKLDAEMAISAGLRERAEKAERMMLIQQEIDNTKLADMLERDSLAIGHQWTDAAAVFMRKAKWMERERDAAETERDNLADLVEKRTEERDSALARAEKAENTHSQHLDGCAAERQTLIALGLIDESGDEGAGVWRNARAEKAERLYASLIEYVPPGHEAHSCGGPQEACMHPGCSECGCPTMPDAIAAIARAERLAGLLREIRDEIYGNTGEDSEGPHPIVDRIDASLAERKEP